LLRVIPYLTVKKPANNNVKLFTFYMFRTIPTQNSKYWGDNHPLTAEMRGILAVACYFDGMNASLAAE
jgi:hypothetical protein